MKSKFKTYGLAITILIAFGLLVSFSYSNHREIRVLSVKVGSSKYAVENNLGKGNIDVQPRECGSCNGEVEYYVYKANPSLWFGRLEDNLYICYEKNTVCGIERIGL